jgi:hypothetical protein
MQFARLDERGGAESSIQRGAGLINDPSALLFGGDEGGEDKVGTDETGWWVWR